MIWAPTSIAFVAKVAPIDMRGRYMGVFGVVGGIAWGAGPIMMGYVYDNVAPVSIWQLALGLGMASTLAFTFMGRMASLSRQPSPVVNPQDEMTE